MHVDEMSGGPLEPLAPGPLTSRNPAFREDVQTTFLAQAAMRLVGARLAAVEHGRVEIRVGIRPELAQQHGVVHGGVVAMVLDAACAFAVASLLPPEHTGFTVNLAVNYLDGAAGDLLVVRGEVLRMSRATAVSQATAYAVAGETAVRAAVATSVLQHFPACAL